MTGLVTIGCDPELFVYSGLYNKPISAHDILPGTKFNPVRVPKGAIQVDGVAAEFNIDPARTRKEFISNIKHVKGILEQILKNKNPDFQLRIQSTAMFDTDYFNSLPAEAKALGCEPDYNAYTGKANPKPETDKPFRTASGHIHIGWNPDTKDPNYIKNCLELVKELDFVLYKSSTFWDKDETRRTLYGQPGSFRFKPYGLEYRVLSNKWLSTTFLQGFVYDCAKAVAEQFLKGTRIRPESKWTGTFADYNSYLKRKKLPAITEYTNNPVS